MLRGTAIVGDKSMFVLGRVWLWLETLRMLCLMRRRRSRKVRVCASMLQGPHGARKALVPRDHLACLPWPQIGIVGMTRPHATLRWWVLLPRLVTAAQCV